MVSKTLLHSLSVFEFISVAYGAFFYPAPQSSLIEHILVDTHGAHKSGFADAITPCTNYVSGSQNFGRETAAQWIRVAFHDFVTAHVAEGLGGIDASIGFETLREEDSGSAFNDSLAFFRPYVNSKISSMFPRLCLSLYHRLILPKWRTLLPFQYQWLVIADIEYVQTKLMRCRVWEIVVVPKSLSEAVELMPLREAFLECLPQRQI